MAAPARLTKFVFGGPLAISESWSCSLHFANATAGAAPEGIVEALQHILDGMPSTAELGWYKWNDINPATGRYANTSVSNTWVVEPPIPGGNGTQIPQAAVVVTLNTLLKRGPAHQGRIYVPSPPQAIGADGRMTPARALQLLTNYRDGLAALQTALGGFMCVWSQKYQAWQVVTTTSCGLVVDTQRRRRKSLDEAPVFLPL